MRSIRAVHARIDAQDGVLRRVSVLRRDIARECERKSNVSRNDTQYPTHVPPPDNTNMSKSTPLIEQPIMRNRVQVVDIEADPAPTAGARFRVLHNVALTEVAVCWAWRAPTLAIGDGRRASDFVSTNECLNMPIARPCSTLSYTGRGLVVIITSINGVTSRYYSIPRRCPIARSIGNFATVGRGCYARFRTD
jgi:hypothetical protein